MWVSMKTSTSFANLTSFQAIEFFGLPRSENAGHFLCQTSENKALKTKLSLTAVRPLFAAKNENTI